MAKKKKRGRPSQGRSEYLEVRLTPEEKQAFETAAEVNGQSLSDWVRQGLRAKSASDLSEHDQKPGFW